LRALPALADIYARIDAQGVAEFSSHPAEGFELYMKSASPSSPATRLRAALGTRNTPYAKVVRAAARVANVQAELDPTR